MLKERDQSKPGRCLMELYAAFYLHASKGFLSVINDNRKMCRTNIKYQGRGWPEKAPTNSLILVI
jgi:hypothetical protein